MVPATLWRLALFLIVLATLTAVERYRPAVVVPQRRRRVRLINYALGVTGALSARLLAATLGVLAARQLEFGMGPLTWLRSLAPQATWLAALCFVLGLLCLDLSLYAQHRLFHALPWLWRWHAVHHSDGHLDASSALRFHPVEIALSWLWKLTIVLLVGISPLVLLAFEMILSSLALFNHCNLRLSEPAERRLAPWLITPAVHRQHHRRRGATKAPNYGFSVPWWDRIAGTWLPAATRAATVPSVGLEEWPAGADAGLLSLLKTN